MDDDDVDLEELENRLYCEVYHSKPDDDNEGTNVNITIQGPDFGVSRRQLRYFEGLSIPEQGQGNFTDGIVNVPTEQYLNPYALAPVIINSGQNVYNDSPGATAREKKLLALQKRRARRKKTKHLRRIERELRRLENLDKQTPSHIRFPEEEENDVISLSDEDCIIVESDQKNVPKIDEINCDSSDDNDEDAVIFVEPEPVPLIDLEEIFPEPNKVLPNERKELLQTPESTASNDFLDNSHVDVTKTSFNFTLHGSDFNNSYNEFVRPLVPQTDNETESSCSTTDLNKDFNNSLRSAVFNEVEFPKGDIFAENNLESFGDYITIKRDNVIQKKTKTGENTETSTPNTYSSGSSSEESDYEESVNKTKNLPELSPMPQNVSKQSRISDTESSSKKKKKQSEGEVIEENVDKNKRKKKKNDEQDSSPENEADTTKTKKKKKRLSEVAEDPQQENTEENLDKTQDKFEPEDPNLEMTPKPKKKKKRLSTTEATTNEITKNNADNQQSDGAEASTKTKKKKKRVSEVLEESTVEENSESPGKIKKKRRLSDSDFIEQTVENTSSNDSQDVQIIDNIELIVVDEVDASSSDESVIPIEPHISVVDVSDSEDDYIDPSIGKDLELANCSTTSINDSQTQNSSNSDTLPVNRTKFSDRWNANQHIFYGTIYNNNFDVDAIKNTMKDDPNCWKILSDDKFPTIQTHRGPRCNSCREFGHLSHRCPVQKEVQCSLCGDSGHYEPRCPNRMCTQCGNPGSYSTTYCWKCIRYTTTQCNICKMFGHVSDKCPDLWRRYHLTTEEGPLVTSTHYNQVKPKHQLWCSGCAQNGHLEQTCGYLTRSYPPSDIKIHKYDDVYGNTNRGPINEERRLAIAPMTSGATNIIIQLPQQGPTNVQNFTFTPSDYIENAQPTHTIQKKELQHSKLFKNGPIKQIKYIIRDHLNLMKGLSENPSHLLKRLYHQETINKKTNNYERKDYKNLIRQINMFLFGIHNFCDGRRHLNHLLSVQNNNNLNMSPAARNDLFFSFNYIFSNQQHSFVNYKHLLRSLMPRKNFRR